MPIVAYLVDLNEKYEKDFVKNYYVFIIFLELRLHVDYP